MVSKVLRPGVCFSPFFQALVTLLLSLAALSVQAEALLWRVDSEKSSVYLLGSIHYGHPDFYPLSASVETAFNDSDVLAVELNPRDVDPQEAGQAIKRYGVYATGETLRRALSSDDWALLQKVTLANFQVDATRFNHFRPWLVAMQLLEMQLKSSEYTQEDGVDRHFIERAGRRSIVELESIGEQLSVFGRLNAEEQAQFLRQSLKEFEQGPAFMSALGEAWHKGDAETLSELIFSAFEGSARAETLFQLMFVERNHRMSDAVERFLRKKKTVFMVVGVGHLLGKEGIVAELERRGYEVSLLSSEGS